MPTREVEGKGGRFQKGRRKTGGRQRGTPNRVTRAVRDFLADLVERPDVQEAVRVRILKGDTIAFFRALEHVLGKPRQALEVNQDAAITFRWAEVERKLEAGRERVAKARAASQDA